MNETQDAVNPNKTGTKSAGHYELQVGAGQAATIRLRLSDAAPATMGDPFEDFANIMQVRQREADQFYKSITPTHVSEDEALVVSVTYLQPRPFHGGNTGSNPVGDANHHSFGALALGADSFRG